VNTVSKTLGLERSRVFPVSAQKGLVAKVMRDDRLLAASRLSVLESALVDLLVPAKQELIGAQTLAVVERIAEEVRQALAARERGVIEQLYELRALQGKNQSSIERMSLRAQAESREFEENVRKIVATRFVMARLSDEATAPLGHATLRATLEATRERMRKVRLTPQFYASVRDYFAALNEHLQKAGEKLAEVEKMVIGVQQKFAAELGWSLPPPMPFSLDRYRGELEQIERASRSHFNAFVVVTRDKWSLIERFFDVVVARTREIFSSAERDTEAWIRSLLPPMEAQVREQRSQLKKRAESADRIRSAQESLDARIGELETALEDVQGKLESLRAALARVCSIGQARPQARDRTLSAPEPAAREADPHEPAWLRVEI
jgi:DNA repair exonuclease SbcCD ATPase subunit